MNYTITTKILALLAFLSLLISFSGLFFVEIRADVNDIKDFTFRQAGYPGTNRYGSNSFKGGQFSIATASYTYQVEENLYSGFGLVNDFDGETISIRYPSFMPFFSISSSFPYFVMGVFFSLMAFGVRAVVVWYRNALNLNDH